VRFGHLIGGNAAAAGTIAQSWLTPEPGALRATNCLQFV
jgi:hypothetical protein